RNEDPHTPSMGGIFFI
ncbi:hypothetical protein, partial [Oceanobacillus limi]